METIRNIFGMSKSDADSIGWRGNISKKLKSIQG
jgi:hypothetical protein